MQLNMAGTYKDPVCGMVATPETAAGKFEYKGVTYYFCSPGCRVRFVADPERYLAPRAPSAPKQMPPAAQRAEYTCPMHPEVG